MLKNSKNQIAFTCLSPKSNYDELFVLINCKTKHIVLIFFFQLREIQHKSKVPIFKSSPK